MRPRSPVDSAPELGAGSAKEGWGGTAAWFAVSCSGQAHKHEVNEQVGVTMYTAGQLGLFVGIAWSCNKASLVRSWRHRRTVTGDGPKHQVHVCCSGSGVERGSSGGRQVAAFLAGLLVHQPEAHQPKNQPVRRPIASIR
jgi:hypothetical protein